MCNRWRGPAVAAAVAASLVLGAAPSVAHDGPAGDRRTAPELLREQGCFIDGFADSGDRLKAAVVRFQSANSLGQDGDLNRRTRTRLASPKARSCDDRVVPKHSGTGRRVVMSQRQNWLWLVREDGSTAAQGGIVDNDWLPQRTYHTGDQCGRPGRARHNSSEDGALRIDYFVRFAFCRVGLHEIPVSKRTGSRLHEDFYAGTDLRKSHGCLRVPHPLVQRLWWFTKDRTKVVVVQG